MSFEVVHFIHIWSSIFLEGVRREYLDIDRHSRPTHTIPHNGIIMPETMPWRSYKQKQYPRLQEVARYYSSRSTNIPQVLSPPRRDRTDGRHDGSVVCYRAVTHTHTHTHTHTQRPPLFSFLSLKQWDMTYAQQCKNSLLDENSVWGMSEPSFTLLLRQTMHFEEQPAHANICFSCRIVQPCIRGN